MLRRFVCLLLLGLSSSAPGNVQDPRQLLLEDQVIYTGQHDIVDIMVPMNGLNKFDFKGMTLFFVEGDIKEDGTVDRKGLYVLKNKTASLLLEHGRDAAATKDASKTAYFAAKDGLYSYNYDTNEAEKYGSITDSLIAVAAENGTGIIYVLTENKELYKVSEEGNKKDKVDDVKAEQMVLDINNNLYYYADKKAYILNADGIKEVQGLPEHTTLKLLRPPFVVKGVTAVVDNNNLCLIFSNGTTVGNDSIRNIDDMKPTAFSFETLFIQYYGVNKKIYEYNILSIAMEGIIRAVGEEIVKNLQALQSFADQFQAPFKNIFN